MSLALRVFLPFAFAYVLAYLLRVVNAVAGAPMTTEFGLSPGDLGLMTSVYFVGFAIAQIPLGILMDRYGPRRVAASAWLFAAVGCLAFAGAAVTSHLLVGRFLIGLGASMALMAPMTAYPHWFSPERRALVIGLHMAFGGIGSALGGGPTEALLGEVGWRGLFVILGIATVGASFLIALVVPRRKEPAGGASFATLGREVLGVFASRSFWRIAPLSATVQAGMLSIVTLWAGPWLRQVVDLTAADAAAWLSATAIGLVGGFVGYGLIFSRAEKAGRAGVAFVAGSFVAVLFPLAFVIMPPSATPSLWIIYAAVGSVGVHSYNLAASAYRPEMAGRVNTALNFLVFVVAFLAQWGFGVVLDAWSDGTGAPTHEGFNVAFLILIAVQLASALPLLVPARRTAALPMAH